MTRPREAADVLADLAALAARQAELTAELAAALRAPAAVPAGTPEYLTTDEAARLFGVSERTLRTLREDGTGPVFIRLGRAVRYPRATLFDGPRSSVQSPSSDPVSAPSGDPRF